MKIVQELRNRANDALLIKAIASEEQLEPADDLLNMAGMERDRAYQLAKHEITHR